MLPSIARAAEVAGAAPTAFPKRMAFVYVPNGVTMPQWTPTGTGSAFQLPRILEPLTAFKDDLTVISGLAQNNGFALGDGAGDHARASATFLTGVHPRKTSGSDIRAGVSVDQLAAQTIGGQTVLPSLELSCDVGQRTGNCDSGYSCAYQYNISWRNESMPMMPEVDPRQAFERLFGDASGGRDSQSARTRRAMFQDSILDFVADDARRLQDRLGRGDQRKLDEYLSAVREIEKRVELAEKSARRLPTDILPPGTYETFEEHAKLMFDMLVLAFQTDSTRVSTFILGHEGSDRSYPTIGVNDGHHSISHHFGNPVNIEKITRINTLHMQQFAYFLDKLKSIKEGEHSLLDNCMIVYGSGISDGNAHNHDNLPLLLAGGANCNIKTGQHIKVGRTPLNNLYLSMLDRLGAPVERFGDSTGRFDALS
jgi:hypothetical protein